MTINPNNTTAACSGVLADRNEMANQIAALPLDQTHDAWPTVVPVRLSETDRDLIVNVLRAQASAPRSASAGDGVREAFRAVDEQDWARLFRDIPDSGHGRFWKEVFGEVRTALSALPTIRIDQDAGIREALEAAERELTDLARPICATYNRTTKKYEFDDDSISRALPGTWSVIQHIRAALASNPLEGKGIQSITEQASSGLRSPTSA